MSKKSPVTAANWKMFKTPQESLSYVKELQIKILDIGQVDVILCVPFTSLFYISGFIEGEVVELGAQNMHWAQEGAYTGAISPGMLKASGAKWVILGHSERRHIFGETDEKIAKKMQSAIRAGLYPILCIGETISERKQGKTVEVLTRQLDLVLEVVAEKNLDQLMVAYEPVWAIGTGVNATPDQIKETHSDIRSLITSFVPLLEDRLRILYGGSVKPDNADELIRVDGVDGFLVGGASLDVDTFVRIIRAVEEYEMSGG